MDPPNHLQGRHSVTNNAEVTNQVNGTQVIEGDLVYVKYVVRPDERADVLSWISKTPYEKHFKVARGGLLEDSGGWLFNNSLFEEWLASDSSGFLWLHGKPGAGKTKLCARLIETLIEQKENVLYFFCSGNLNQPDVRDSKSILRAFVHQLSLNSPHDKLPELIMKEYRKRHSTGMVSGRLDSQECRDFIIALLKGYRRTTIVIDGLDECYAEEKSSLLSSLKNIVDASTTLVRVLISSRDDRDIEVRLPQSLNLTIDEKSTKKDMERFVKKELERCIEDKDLLHGDVSLELEEKVAAELLAKASGMFLWVSLQIKLLCEMQTERQLLSWLGRLPTTLIKIYDGLYERISGPSFEEAQLALAWLMCAREPLRPEQWASAVSWALWKNRTPGDAYPTRSNFRALLDMCQYLVLYDEIQDSMTYVHFSVREYLEKKPQLPKLILETMAAESCLCFMINMRLPRPSELEYGFYKYSARHWVTHVKNCDEWLPELDEFLGTWLEPSDAYREWKSAVELFGRRYREYEHADEIGTLTNGLLLAAYHGILHTALWNRGHFDPDATDERGLSLLALASQKGQREMVKMLVRKGAKVNPLPVQIDAKTAMTTYKPRRTYLSPFDVDKSHPLFLAIRGGHPEVVTLLLDFGASIQGMNTLEVAASYGSPNVILSILQRDPSLTVKDKTVVQAVTNESYPETLKICLERCPNSCITGGVVEAILDLDSRRDPEGVVKQLLANRITARVLTGMWRMTRMSILKKLMAWIPNLPVTADVVAELAGDSLPGDDGIVDVLRAQLPGASITAATLKGVFSAGQGAVNLLKAIMETKAGPIPKSELSKDSTESETLELLFQKSVHIPISEDVVLAAIQNEWESLELVRLLVSRDRVSKITPKIVKAAVSNETHGVDILKHLFGIKHAIPVTEEVAVAAVENKNNGFNVIELFVSNSCNLPITEPVLKAAAGNSSCGSKIMELLLKDEAFRVSEDIVTAAVSSGDESLKILELLLARKTPVPITNSVLKAAAKNPSKGFQIIELLFSRNTKITVTQSLVSAAAQNASQGLKLIRFLQTKTDFLPISEDVIWPASGNKNIQTEMMDFLLGESAKVDIGTSVLRAAAIVGNTTWFSKLLSKADPLVIKTGYGPIFLAAIESEDPDILKLCIDYGGLWTGTDEHGWNAELMALHKMNDELLSRIQSQRMRSVARPLLSTTMEIPDVPGFLCEGTILQFDGDNKSNQMVRADHPFAPLGTSYFEMKILELGESKKPSQRSSASLGIGVTDEYLQYSPSQYTNIGYVHDFYLMRQYEVFEEGDTVGYGIDWNSQEQFITKNGVRHTLGMDFRQLVWRRLFPYVKFYSWCGRCKLRANFRGPFKYLGISRGHRAMDLY